MELTDGIDRDEKQLVAAERRMAFEDMMRQCGNPWGYSAGALESKQAAMSGSIAFLALFTETFP